jgi:hypothetical protein
MPNLPVSTIEITRIPEQKGVHDPAQWDLIDLDQEVEMIFHQPIGIKTERESALDVRKVGQKPLEVLVVPKDTLSSIPSCNDMMQGPGKMNSGFPCHDNSLSNNQDLVNTELPWPGPSRQLSSKQYGTKNTPFVQKNTVFFFAKYSLDPIYLFDPF